MAHTQGIPTHSPHTAQFPDPFERHARTRLLGVHPHAGEVGCVAEVLRDCDGVFKVQHRVPPEIAMHTGYCQHLSCRSDPTQAGSMIMSVLILRREVITAADGFPSDLLDCRLPNRR